MTINCNTAPYEAESGRRTKRRQEYFSSPGLLRRLLSPVLLLTCVLCGPLPAAASEMYVPGTMSVPGGIGVMNALPLQEAGTNAMNRDKAKVYAFPGNDAGFALPGGDGAVLWVPAPTQGPAAAAMDARELKLKVRELTEQLIAGMDGVAWGTIAVPTVFVNQDDFTRTSSLGRFMAEQLFYEFNQRGYPTREYRLASQVRSKEGRGEFLLSRAIPPISAKNKSLVFVVGTYYADRQAIFLNARLVRGTDGTVLRTGQVILPNNAMTRRMLAGGTGRQVASGSIPVRDFTTATHPTNLTPIDLGQDIH